MTLESSRRWAAPFEAKDPGYRSRSWTGRQSARPHIRHRFEPEFDLLFTDVVMPGKLDGIGLAWELRKRRPELPIILTSGFSDPEVIATDLGALRATLLPKPYRKADLSLVIRRALEQ